jgi:hypothetical protein
MQLKEITFGLRCPSSVVHTITRALSGRVKPLRYYEIYEVRGLFVLRRGEVDQGELGAYMPKEAMSGVEIFGDPIEDQYSGDQPNESDAGGA